MKAFKLASMAAAAAVTTLTASSVFAQATAEGQVGMALPGANQPQAGAAAGESDHDQMIGHVGFGYLGRVGVPIATSFTAPDQAVLQAPVIGIRYWLDQMIGIDAGLGFFTSSGSTEVTAGGANQTTDDPSPVAVLIHGGVPLSLASSQHFSFQIVPELNVGFASSSLKADVQQGRQFDEEYTGFTFDVGARVGGEIHFGFMDIPQLALQGSVGVLFSTQNTKGTQKSTPETSVKRSSSQFRTTVYEEPWDAFTGNIAALYYF